MINWLLNILGLFGKKSEEELMKSEYSLYVSFVEGHGEKPLGYKAFLKKHHPNIKRDVKKE